MSTPSKNIGKSYKIAASILALIIGLMSVFAGSKVLLGIDVKEYNVLDWLVYYNVAFGVISIFTAYFIWQGIAKGKSLSLFILSMHFVVFLYLKFLSDTAAPESIKAMIFRTSIWVVIVALTILIPEYMRKQKG
ncbi:MAG: hypothetical protein ABJG78_02070 [Cyclobacteriaceae bacterium]